MTTLHLIEAEAGRPFPFTIGPAFAWAVLGDALHVAASVGAAGDTACHVAIDARGRTSTVWVPPQLGPLFTVFRWLPAPVWRRVAGNR